MNSKAVENFNFLENRPFLAPLISAFILPGLGQYLSGNRKKGLFLMILASAAFLGGLIVILQQVSAAFQMPEGVEFSLAYAQKALAAKFGVIALALAPLIIVWLGALIDALICVFKAPKLEMKKRD